MDDPDGSFIIFLDVFLPQIVAKMWIEKRTEQRKALQQTETFLTFFATDQVTHQRPQATDEDVRISLLS
jgi:hypothetical protein